MWADTCPHPNPADRGVFIHSHYIIKEEGKQDGKYSHNHPCNREALFLIVLDESDDAQDDRQYISQRDSHKNMPLRKPRIANTRQAIASPLFFRESYTSPEAWP